MRLEKGPLNSAWNVQHRPLSHVERDRVRGDPPFVTLSSAKFAPVGLRSPRFERQNRKAAYIRLACYTSRQKS
jgi:hypothetical protein